MVFSLVSTGSARTWPAAPSAVFNDVHANLQSDHDALTTHVRARPPDPCAGYALHHHAVLRGEVRHVPYDVTAAQAAISAAGLPSALASRLAR